MRRQIIPIFLGVAIVTLLSLSFSLVGKYLSRLYKRKSSVETDKLEGQIYP